MTDAQHRKIVRYTVIVLASLVALILSVWMVGSRSAAGIRSSESKAREQLALAQTNALRKACPRSVNRDFELLATNEDLLKIARSSEERRRVEERIVKIRKRLPASDDGAVIAKYCVSLFPLVLR
jgi:hypothetical protein